MLCFRPSTVIMSGVTVATATVILSRRWRKSPILTAQTIFSTHPHMNKWNGVRSGLLAGRVYLSTDMENWHPEQGEPVEWNEAELQHVGIQRQVQFYLSIISIWGKTDFSNRSTRMSLVMVLSTKINVPLQGHSAVHTQRSTSGYHVQNQRIYSAVVIAQDSAAVTTDAVVCVEGPFFVRTLRPSFTVVNIT